MLGQSGNGSELAQIQLDAFTVEPKAVTGFFKALASQVSLMTASFHARDKVTVVVLAATHVLNASHDARWPLRVMQVEQMPEKRGQSPRRTFHGVESRARTVQRGDSNVGGGQVRIGQRHQQVKVPFNAR